MIMNSKLMLNVVTGFGLLVASILVMLFVFHCGHLFYRGTFRGLSQDSKTASAIFGLVLGIILNCALFSDKEQPATA